MTDKHLFASEKDVQKKALIPSAGHVTRWWSKIIRNCREALTGQRRSDLPTFLVRYINNNLPKQGGSSRLWIQVRASGIQVVQFNDGELLEFRETLASTATHKRVTCQRLSQRNNGYQIIGQRFFADELKILDYYKGNEGRCK